jgi:hypothetical protein
VDRKISEDLGSCAQVAEQFRADVSWPKRSNIAVFALDVTSSLAPPTRVLSLRYVTVFPLFSTMATNCP